MVALYLGDLWHSKDRLTAAGDTTAPCSWAREAQDLWAGAGFGAKMGGGFTQGRILVRYRGILRKALRDVRSSSSSGGSPTLEL